MDGTGGSRGVSPVVGAVLLVAIVVVLAATVATGVLQFGDEDPQIRPQVAATAEYDERTDANGEYVNITFRAGDTANTHNLSLVLSDAEVVDPPNSEPASLEDDLLKTEVGSEIRSGDTVSINLTAVEKDSGGSINPSSEHLELDDATVRLIWDPEDPDADESSTIWRWEPRR